MPVAQELLDILVCPLGKKPLRLEGGDRLVCTHCGLSYRIEDDIPVMLVEEATLPPGVASIEDLPCRDIERRKAASTTQPSN